MNRRDFNKLLGALPAAPLTHLTQSSAAHADAGEKVDEASDLARELGYRHDALQVDTAAYPKRAGVDGENQFCGTCQFFTEPGATGWGECVVFSGKLVNAGGWCSSWFKRAG